MALEKECDLMLNLIYEELKRHPRTIICREDVKHTIIGDDLKTAIYPILDNVLSILVVEEHLKRIPYDDYKITDKGIAFLNTDTYVERKKRWDTDNYLKSFQYRIRYVPYILSALSVLLALYAAITSHKLQTLKEAEQEKKVMSTMQTPSHSVDTSLKKVGK